MNIQWRVSGLTSRSSLSPPMFGCTDTDMVALDFDDTSFKTVKYWAQRAMNWHNLEGFIILKSSEGCYHVVFNRSVDWTENMRVVAWVAELSGNEGLRKWHRMQCIKIGSTLRISSKGEKPPPRIVYREGDQDEQIREFLKFRNLIKKYTSTA